MRRAKTILLALVSLLLLGFPASAELYQWTDADGVRHFSNLPPPKGIADAEQIEEIPYDPETDAQRRAEENDMLRERQAAETQARLEKAERDAAEARRQAEAARRKAEQLEKQLEAQEEDNSDRVYYPTYRPGQRPPGWRPPPAQRPPGQRPPGQKPPGWRPRPEPYRATPE